MQAELGDAHLAFEGKLVRALALMKEGEGEFSISFAGTFVGVDNVQIDNPGAGLRLVEKESLGAAGNRPAGLELAAQRHAADRERRAAVQIEFSVEGRVAAAASLAAITLIQDPVRQASLRGKIRFFWTFGRPILSSWRRRWKDRRLRGGILPISGRATPPGRQDDHAEPSFDLHGLVHLTDFEDNHSL